MTSLAPLPTAGYTLILPPGWLRLDARSEHGQTRVDYQEPLPSEPLKWALATFTTVGGGKPEDDITELLVGLFDAIMLTWSWRPGLAI